MKIQVIKPSAAILGVSENALSHIETCGRTCYKSEDRIKKGSAGRFVKMICRNHHESVLEHATMTAKVVCSRACSHQLVRHRIGAYSQESQRYVNYVNRGYQVILPRSWGVKIGEYDMAEFGGHDGHGWRPKRGGPYDPQDEMPDTLLGFLAFAFEAYEKALTGPDKVKPEDARYFLPNACKTEVVVSYNFRTWRHVFRERALNPKAQWEIREIMLGLFNRMKDTFEPVFGDLEKCPEN